MQKKVNYISYLLFLIFVFASCDKASNFKQKEKNLSIDSSHQTTALIDDTKPKKLYTKLPFVDRMVHKGKRQILPTIDSVIYLKLNTSFDFNFRKGEQLKHLKYFNNQLPNINKYEVYYTAFNCRETQNAFLKEACGAFVELIGGFLIFYDPTTKFAKIINIKNSYYIDSGIDMNFRIDEHYKIHLEETGMTDGDVEPEEEMISETYYLSQHLIEVDANGEIQIEQKKAVEETTAILQEQIIKDTFFLKNEKNQHFEHKIFIEENRNSNAHKRLTNFKLSAQEIDNLAMHQAHIDATYLSSKTKHHFDELPKAWIPLYQFKEAYYLYAPSDWGNSRKMLLTDSSLITFYMDGPFGEPLYEMKQLSDTKYKLTIKYQPTKALKAKEVFLHILDQKTKRTVWEFRNAPDEIEYRHFIPKEYADQFDVIVNYCKDQKQLEYKFEPQDLEQLIKR